MQVTDAGGAFEQADIHSWLRPHEACLWEILMLLIRSAGLTFVPTAIPESLT